MDGLNTGCRVPAGGRKKRRKGHPFFPPRVLTPPGGFSVSVSPTGGGTFGSVVLFIYRVVCGCVFLGLDFGLRLKERGIDLSMPDSINHNQKEGCWVTSIWFLKEGPTRPWNEFDLLPALLFWWVRFNCLTTSELEHGTCWVSTVTVCFDNRVGH